MESQTVQKNAGIELDRRAREYMQARKTDYRTALFAVSKGDVARRYAYGEPTLKQYDTLTAAQRAMAELLADPGKTMTLAGFALDKLAREKLVNVGKGVDDPVAAYRRALTECKEKYPDLNRAASDGFLGERDFATLALLVPSVAAEVERGNYSDNHCSCGQNKALCRGRKLAKKRGIHEDDVREFAACIRDAQEHGTELDKLACYFR